MIGKPSREGLSPIGAFGRHVQQVLYECVHDSIIMM